MAARSRRFSEADAAFGIGRGKTFENMIGDSWRTMQVALKSSRPESLATRRYVRFQKRDRGEHRKQYCPRPRTELAGLLLYSLPNTRIAGKLVSMLEPKYAIAGCSRLHTAPLIMTSLLRGIAMCQTVRRCRVFERSLD